MKRTVLTVVGARPQFIKAAVTSRCLGRHGDIVERIVHTGQHYDARMSRVFFDELGLPEPDFQLKVGSCSHAEQTARMLMGLEQIMLQERPDAVLVYGDTNSTLAGALAAAKLNLPLVHVEAGLRSHDRTMPEEINRIVTDRLSSLLLCPTRQAVQCLADEGITAGVHLVGDVMCDAVVQFSSRADAAADQVLRQFGLLRGKYVLWTCHRAANTDNPARLKAILDAASTVASQTPVVFPVHPRLLKKGALTQRSGEFMLPCDCPPQRIAAPQRSRPAPLFVAPLSYLEMLALQKHAAVVVTDSGGMQKEAFILGVPCITIRDHTEWTETLRAGANRLVEADRDRIVDEVRKQLLFHDRLPDAAEHYGGGNAGVAIARLVAEMVGATKHNNRRAAA